jgi:Alpha 1,4-glycosyltransferase conserved region
MLDKECFVGFQQKEENVDWVNNAIFGARPGHPFLKSCMNLTEEAFRSKGVFRRSPAVTTAVLKEWGLRDYGLQEIQGVTLYPTEYFYPYPWHGEFAPDCVGEDTYCIHYWEGTWLKKRRHKALSPFRIMKRAVQVLLPRSGKRGNLKRH